jgi:hypothetical protein
MVATQKAVNGFKIPKRTARLIFSGDYDGAEVVVRLDVPVATFLDIQNLVSDEEQLKVFELFGDKVLDEWNLEDEDGKPYPPTGLGMNAIPIHLANNILEQWVEVATKVPDPLERK